MKTINFRNQPDFEAIEAAGIIFTCDTDMNLEISDEDYERLEAEFPAAFDDCYIVPTITTMGDLADYINAADEWPLDVWDIIERNGWVSDCGTSWGICHNDTEKVVFNDDGVAVVLDVEKTLEEIAYENGLEIVETTSERTGYPSHMMDALTGFSSFAEAKRIADEHNLTLIWIDQRDGWQIWHRGDMASEPMSINSSDFGDDYNFEDDSDDFMEMARERIADMCENGDSFDDIRAYMEKIEEVTNAIDNLEEGQVVVTFCGEYYDTIDTHPISFSFDTKHTQLAAIK